MFFYEIFHVTVHESCKKTADHGNRKDNSNFYTFTQFAETSDKQPHRNTDQASEQWNDKHFSYLSLKIQFQYDPEINE